ncbi:MAG: hypothetical protein BECKG1743D_GA0114223_102111, partial [Candidatus Kentron sp. G]
MNDGGIFYLGEEGNIHGIPSAAKPQRVSVVLPGSLSISLLAIGKAGLRSIAIASAGRNTSLFAVLRAILLSVHFLFFVHVFGPLSLPRRG